LEQSDDELRAPSGSRRPPAAPDFHASLGAPRRIDEVTVEWVDMTDDEQIVAVCAHGKFRQRVPILGLPLPDPPPEGAEWIDAFRQWARRN
jgi:hypothetical protein